MHVAFKGPKLTVDRLEEICNKIIALSFFRNTIRTYPLPRGGWYLQKNLVGVYGTLPENLTLFQTKSCDFPHPISDLLCNQFPRSDQC